MGTMAKLCAGVAAMGGAFLFGLAILAGGIDSSAAEQGAATSVLGQLGQKMCVQVGPVPTLTTAQATNAETIVAAAETLGAAERGAQIRVDGGLHGIIVGEPRTRGGQRRLDRPLPAARGGGLGHRRRGAGSDRCDRHVHSATDCGPRLAEHRTLGGGPGRAAQCVRRRYELRGELEPGRGLFRAVTGLADNQNCGGENGAEPAGPAGRFGLPTDFVIPPDATPAETLVITYAISKLGDAYVWGAAGPNSFDCSGLTMMAWAQAGVPLDHYTGDQLNEGTPVAGYAAISPGDLVLIPGSDGTLADPGHVGIFIGYGLVLSAVDPQQGVIVQTWANFTAGGLSGIRHLG